MLQISNEINRGFRCVWYQEWEELSVAIQSDLIKFKRSSLTLIPNIFEFNEPKSALSILSF
jgi:hypothetical protein